jgi:lysophospholipase L1-like esterase
MRSIVVAAATLMAMAGAAGAQRGPAPATKWVTAWAASVQGPYPVGNPSAQPDQSFAFPDPTAGARNQTFRLIVRPTIWGREARLRFSNTFGSKPLTINGAHVGLQLGGAVVIKGSNRAVTFGGKSSVTIAPGASVWSDPVAVAVRDPDSPELMGRKLAISFHVAGESGPMTWHAKALQTSYVTAPGAGARGAEEGEASFPFGTSSWFFLDALDMRMRADSFAIVAIGDSITDGTSSTMNGDDRWPDVLARRLQAVHGNRIAVVNAGIGGNRIAGPAKYDAANTYPGGPSARSRLDRDVLALSGVATLIWLEGINDFSKLGDETADKVMETLQDGVAHLRKSKPEMRILAGTVLSALGATIERHGFVEQDEKRKTLNTFIRASGLFDGVIEFDRVTFDERTGGLKPEMVPDSTTGGPGDKLHPNRAGYVAMAHAVDLDSLLPKKPSGTAATAERSTPNKGRQP